MSNFKSLVSGVGNLSKTTKYYDDWSENYDATLKLWNYQAPKKSIKFLKETINIKPKNILDLACGTGLFGAELKKVYPKSHIYGSDISKKSLKISSGKKIYKKLQIKNFEQLHHYKIKFDLISLIGSMTYCKNFDRLFSNIKKGILLFISNSLSLNNSFPSESKSLYVSWIYHIILLLSCGLHNFVQLEKHSFSSI